MYHTARYDLETGKCLNPPYEDVNSRFQTAFYAYYPDKHALLQEIQIRTLAGLRDVRVAAFRRADSLPSAQAKAAIAAVVRFAAQHPEESEWLVGELREEHHAQDVEQAAQVDAGPEQPGLAALLEVAYGHFHHAEALTIRQHRQVPVHIAVDRQVLEHLAPEDAQGAVQVVEVGPDEAPHDPVEGIGLQAVEPGVDPRLTP